VRWESTEYAPKRVAGVTHKNRDGSDRQRILKSCRPGMRVVLAREPDNPVDMNAVAVRVAGGQQIGYLAADVAKWVSPWLESGQVDFKCRIKSVEPFESDDGRTMLGAEITMTRLELVPGDPRLVALAKVAALPFVAVVRAAAMAGPAMRVVFRVARARVASICHRVVVGSRTIARPTVAAALAGLKKIDNGLATLADGNPVMLNVFRVTAALGVSTLFLIGLLLLV